MPPRGARLATAAGLVLAVVLAFSPVLRADFVDYDDPDYVTENRLVRAGWTMAGWRAAWTGVHQATWHPLTTLSHMLDCELFGLDAGAHHAVNLLLHAATTLLVALALERLTGQTERAVLVAALFALHPLRVESVAWISERKDVLSGFFFALTLLAYSAYARAPSPRRYLAVTIALVAGLLAKPMLVTLPLVLLLLDFWPLRRVAWPGGTASLGLLRSRAFTEKLPWLAAAGAVGVVTILAQASSRATASLGVIPPGDRIATAAVSLVAYLADTAWPSALCFFYPRGPVSWGTVAASTALLVGLTAGTVRAARAATPQPALLVGWLWFLVMLTPVSGLFQVGDQARADRFTYLPSIGLGIAVVWGLADLMERLRADLRVRRALALAWLTGLVLATARQATTWHDGETLFRHAIAVRSDNHVARNNLGLLLARGGRVEEARAQLEESVRLRADNAAARLNLGGLLVRTGEYERGVAELRAALALDPRRVLARQTLGDALAGRGDLAGAQAEYEQAVALDPNLADVQNNLGAVLSMQGKPAQALAAFEAALRADPDAPDARLNLARALGELGRYAAAREQLRAAAARMPDPTAARQLEEWLAQRQAATVGSD